MSLIKFKDSSDDEKIDANLSLDPLGRVKISFTEDNIPDESVLLGGFFEINEHNFIEQSDFSNMNYIYQKIDDLTYILTHDENDIYADPEISDYEESIPIGDYPESLPAYTPTIDEIRNMKISSLSSICNKQIINGVDIDIDGVIEHFGYSNEDQTNIKELFDLAVQTNVPMYYHSDGNSCKLYTVDQIIAIYTTATMNKMHHITYFNQLKMYLRSLEDSETISGVEYGYELTDEYQSTYNSAMEQAKASIEALLNT